MLTNIYVYFNKQTHLNNNNKTLYSDSSQLLIYKQYIAKKCNFCDKNVHSLLEILFSVSLKHDKNPGQKVASIRW